MRNENYGKLYTEEASPEHLGELLKEYEYLYIANTTDVEYIKSVFGECFQGGRDAVALDTVYKIYYMNGHVQLVQSATF